MASRARVTPEHIDLNLRWLWAEINGMPETEREWPEFTADDQYDFIVEWPDLLGRFRTLIKAEADGLLNEEQQARYEALVKRYAEVLPIIDRLNLGSIPVPQLRARR